MRKDTTYSSKEKSTQMIFQFLISMPQTQGGTKFVKEILLQFNLYIDTHTGSETPQYSTLSNGQVFPTKT